MASPLNHLLLTTSVFLPLFASADSIEKLPNGGLKAVTENYEVELINPNSTDFKITGGRFIRGGWLRQLKPTRIKQSLIVGKSVFSYHTAYGLTFEFVPDIKLRNIDERFSEHLKIGVGRIKRDNAKGFPYDRPVAAVPWQYRINSENEIEYIQDSGKPIMGYAWQLTNRIQFFKESIRFVQTLKNTGSKKLELETFVHPFFNATQGKARCKFIMPRLRSGKVDLTALTAGNFKPGLLVAGKELPPGVNWVAGLNITDNNFYCLISTDDKLYKTMFWRNVEGSFAVEPFIKISLPPGKRRNWTWKINFGSGTIPEKLIK